MKRTLAVLVAVAACGGDDGGNVTPDAPAPICESSTAPQTSAEWDACRAVNVDSWPLFCADGEVPPPCAFTVNVDGADVFCRPAGACE